MGGQPHRATRPARWALLAAHQAAGQVAHEIFAALQQDVRHICCRYEAAYENETSRLAVPSCPVAMVR